MSTSALFAEKKTLNLPKFMVCLHGQGWRGVEL